MSTVTRPTKNHIELQKLQNQLQVRLGLVEAAKIVGAILAVAVALLALGSVVDPLAGRRTVVDASLVFPVGFALSVAVNVGQGVKGASRKRRLKEARRRADELEQRLGIEMKGGFS
jgi:hypothetical protein